MPVLWKEPEEEKDREWSLWCCGRSLCSIRNPIQLAARIIEEEKRGRLHFRKNTSTRVQLQL